MMTALCRSRLSGLLLPTLLFATCVPTSFAAEPIFHTRSYHPFTQIFGRPEFFAGSVLPQGTTEARATLNIVSHTEPVAVDGELLELDGETYHIDFSLDHAFTDRWETGVRLPFIRHSGGFMDSIVENWHDVIGASNAQRDVRERNQLNFIYQRDGITLVDLNESGQGIGDIQLRTRYQLLSAKMQGRNLALHGGIKLPTGNEDALRGSGAVDYSLGIGYSDPISLQALNMTLSAHGGVMFLGQGTTLGEIQESTVPFGGIQLGWHPLRRFDLLFQVQATGSYYTSVLTELGDPTVQLSIGANIRFPESGWNWTLGIVEDAFSHMMPDFALHTEISWRFPRR